MPLLRLFPIAVALLFTATALPAQVSVTPADIDRLVGAGWAGTLTYRDYSNEARTTIKAALLLERMAEPSSAHARWDWRNSVAPASTAGLLVVLNPQKHCAAIAEAHYARNERCVRNGIKGA